MHEAHVTMPVVGQLHLLWEALHGAGEAVHQRLQLRWCWTSPAVPLQQQLAFNRNDNDLPDPTSFMQFDQTALGSEGDGMFDFGMAYIPKACLASSNSTGNGCRLHLHFHGTRMNIQGCDRLHSPLVVAKTSIVDT